MAYRDLLVPNNINLNLKSSETLNITSTTESISESTGALLVSGGAGIAKNLFVGTRLYAPVLNATLANAPSPKEGDLYFNTATKKLMLYNSIAWVALN